MKPIDRIKRSGPTITQPVSLRTISAGPGSAGGDAGRLADPLDPVSRDLAQITGKRMKTAADHFEIARIEWHGGLWLKNGSPCIPAEPLEASVLSDCGPENVAQPFAVEDQVVVRGRARRTVVECQSALKFDPIMEWALEWAPSGGQNQVAGLTVCREC
ncbi:hypothetical protein V1282_005635 [Nitrobacteraceae bacterium AZCC 2146]